MRPWKGVIAFVGVETTDGRVIDELRIANLPRPLMGMELGYPSKIIGRIDSAEVGDDGAVRAEGVVERPPGHYGIGVDLYPSEITQPGHGQPMRCTGSLASAAVYDPSTRHKAAWPDAEIEVSDDGSPVPQGD